MDWSLFRSRWRTLALWRSGPLVASERVGRRPLPPSARWARTRTVAADPDRSRSCPGLSGSLCRRRRAVRFRRPKHETYWASAHRAAPRESRQPHARSNPQAQIVWWEDSADAGLSEDPGVAYGRSAVPASGSMAQPRREATAARRRSAVQSAVSAVSFVLASSCASTYPIPNP